MKTPPKPKSPATPMGVPNPGKLPPATPIAIDKYMLAVKKPAFKKV